MKFYGIKNKCCKDKNMVRTDEDLYQCFTCKRLFKTFPEKTKQTKKKLEDKISQLETKLAMLSDQVSKPSKELPKFPADKETLKKAYDEIQLRKLEDKLSRDQDKTNKAIIELNKKIELEKAEDEYIHRLDPDGSARRQLEQLAKNHFSHRMNTITRDSKSDPRIADGLLPRGFGNRKELKTIAELEALSHRGTMPKGWSRKLFNAKREAFLGKRKTGLSLGQKVIVKLGLAKVKGEKD